MGAKNHMEYHTPNTNRTERDVDGTLSMAAAPGPEYLVHGVLNGNQRCECADLQRMQILIVEAVEPSPTKDMNKLIRTCSLYAESGKPIKLRGRGWGEGVRAEVS